jgi:3'(2'), 5'-bisphosphate nucleotidase
MFEQFNIEQVTKIAASAGEIIMRYRNTNQKIDIKEDNSPVTEADLAASHYIVSSLHTIAPNIPVVSEEEIIAQDKLGETFWLVDPIDGTKSFIRGSDEFTVNIALIHQNEPVLGVIYVPATEILYYASQRAYKQVKRQKIDEIRTRPPNEETVILLSRLSRNQEIHNLLANYPNAKINAISSSLKFCVIAEGNADLYPRFGPTKEWDTAAGHAILNAAGGSVRGLDTGPLFYGKANFENSYFIARGN